MRTVATALPVAPQELATGWPVIVACTAAAIFAWGFGAFGPAVYFAELKERYGWPAATIGGATTLAFITGALLLPFVGAAIERFGPRRVLTSGLLLIGTGVVGVSQVTAPWQLYGWNLLIGGGWAGASSTAISTTLAWHFDRRRGLALSLALTGASAGGFAIAPALVTLSHRLGFATAVPVLVLGSLAPVLPLLWIGMRRRHGAWSAARAADRPSSGAACRLATLLQTRFWSIAGPFALAISAQVGVMTFEVSYLLPLLGTGATSLALMGTSLAAAAGRLVVSPLIDHLDQRPIAAATFAIQALGLALMIFLPHVPAGLFAGTILFGLCMGNVVVLPTLVIQREFTPAAFAQTLGLSTAIGQIGYSLSPALLGLVRDLSGGYRATLAVCIGLQVLAAIIIVFSTLPKRRWNGRGSED